MCPSEMERFWDQRAREDAFYFVDDQRKYRATPTGEFWATGRDTLDAVLASVDAAVGPHDVVVDLGCGVGRLTRALAERARQVHAIDVSAEMVARAQELNAQLGNVTWHHGDGASLRGIDDASADAVVSHVVFQHIPDPSITLGYVREIGRVLRPGGWAAFQVSNDPSAHEWRRTLRERLAAALGRAPKGQDQPAWLGSAVDLDDLRAAAAEGGMDVAQVAGEGTQFCFVRTVKPG